MSQVIFAPRRYSTMTRHFSLRKMLANTPKCLLREFFDKIGQQPLSLDWNRLPGRKPEPLMMAISLMDPVVQAHIETELARIFELACASGIQTYLEASRNAGFSGTPPGFPTNVTACRILHRACEPDSLCPPRFFLVLPCSHEGPPA
jgi:hypothetical protein